MKLILLVYLLLALCSRKFFLWNTTLFRLYVKKGSPVRMLDRDIGFLFRRTHLHGLFNDNALTYPVFRIFVGFQ